MVALGAIGWRALRYGPIVKPDQAPSSWEKRTDKISFVVILPLASFSARMSCCALGRPAGITISPPVTQRRRNEIGSGRHDHLVKRRML